MRDHIKLRAVELADEVAMLVYRVTAGIPKEEDSLLIEPKVVETEKVLNGLMRCEMFYSLQPSV
jgi:hypothetical protein